MDLQFVDYIMIAVIGGGIMVWKLWLQKLVKKDNDLGLGCSLESGQQKLVKKDNDLGLGGSLDSGEQVGSWKNSFY